MIISILLNQMSFLPWAGDSTAFWVCLVASLVFLLLSLNLAEEQPVTSVFLNLLCAGSVYLLTGLHGELFWFINIERVNWLIWFVCYLLTAAFFGMVLGLAWGHLKLISELFDNTLAAILGLVIGLIWGFLLLRLVGIIFEEHPIVCVLTLICSISSGSSSHVPTIYVSGEGHITGRGYHGGDRFTGDNGRDYWYDGSKWHKS